MTFRNIILSALLICITATLSAQKISYGFFKFAVISDTHITVENKASIDNFNAILQDITSQKEIAFVVLTGDITEKADKESMEEAFKALKASKLKYQIIPGNHDTRNDRENTFTKTFGDNRFSIIFNGFHIIGVNTGSPFANSEGHITPQDLLWASGKLKARGTKAPTILMAHHPLIAGEVDNWHSMTDLLRKYNTQVVIGGHYHRNSVLNYDAIPGITLKDSRQTATDSLQYSVVSIQDSIYFFNKTIGGQAQQWTALPIEAKQYDQGNRRLFPLPNYEINKNNKKLRIVWSKENKVSYSTSPVIENGIIYCLNDLQNVEQYTLDKGKELKNPTKDVPSFTTTKEQTENHRLTTDKNGMLIYNDENGNKLWEYKLCNSYVNPPVAISDTDWIITTTCGTLCRIRIIH